MPTQRDPRTLAWPDLVWSHFSRPRFGNFEERLDAAAAAGFAGIGLYLYEFERLRTEEGLSCDAIAAAFDQRGLCLAELEAIRGWWATGGEVKAEFDHAADLAFEMAGGIGARYLQAIGPFDCSFEQAVDGFGRLCDRAAAFDVKVGIEWLPFTNIVDAAQAQQLVEAVGRPNAGYCADIWHHVRGANDIEMIRRLPGERVFAVQMNDGPVKPVLPDYKADCMAHRVAPGSGEFDCVGYIRTMIEIGVTAPISLEVVNASMWEMPAEHTARMAADGMRAVLAAAGV